eukprot:CAMPEP_0183368924 /NCGR_PEP_ID=MMETSP0164_2-20130417/97634_1 /TAXON_ID=221442 /ORGANISM="Coccolithus pelagicus ssp braarudi, Strain PLY182g" /LENGTH=212 /DNA_ID=CAMNT_0025545101 /DNA_START=56 /DNA_END=691 /DNA_ORIENTATION=+
MPNLDDENEQELLESEASSGVGSAGQPESRAASAEESEAGAVHPLDLPSEDVGAGDDKELSNGPCRHSSHTGMELVVSLAHTRVNGGGELAGSAALASCHIAASSVALALPLLPLSSDASMHESDDIPVASASVAHVEPDADCTGGVASHPSEAGGNAPPPSTLSVNDGTLHAMSTTGDKLQDAASGGSGVNETWGADEDAMILKGVSSHGF